MPRMPPTRRHLRLPRQRLVHQHFLLSIITRLRSATLSSVHFSKLPDIGNRKMGGSSNLETRSLFDELKHFEKGGFFDLGHPLLNRITESFVKAAGIGAIQAVSREAYFTAVEGTGFDSGSGVPEITGARKQRLPKFRGETSKNSIEAMVKNTGKESLQWGMVAGMYGGLTYGLREARGCHDWRNSAVAGAVTGAALALTSEDKSHEQIVQYAITGAALSTAANLLTGIF